MTPVQKGMTALAAVGILVAALALIVVAACVLASWWVKRKPNVNADLDEVAGSEACPRTRLP